jgi:hypothetical protein
MTHTSHIILHLPEHRFLYTGLVKKDADKAASAAREAGYPVIVAAKPVTGSKRSIWHYTVIRTGRAA